MNAVAAILFSFLVMLGLVFVYDGYVKDADLAPKGMEQEHVVTVLEKTYDSYSDSTRIKVRTEENDIETYQTSNSYLKNKWKQEDRAEALELNHTYWVKTWGVRNSALRTYKDIIELRELSDPAEIASESARIRDINEQNRKQLEMMLNNTSRQTA